MGVGRDAFRVLSSFHRAIYYVYALIFFKASSATPLRNAHFIRSNELGDRMLLTKGSTYPSSFFFFFWRDDVILRVVVSPLAPRFELCLSSLKKKFPQVEGDSVEE
jgi:hypothetical protein